LQGQTPHEEGQRGERRERERGESREERERERRKERGERERERERESERERVCLLPVQHCLTRASCRGEHRTRKGFKAHSM
jgi:hypothetical protein